jgi:hypothetical protein
MPVKVRRADWGGPFANDREISSYFLSLFQHASIGVCKFLRDLQPGAISEHLHVMFAEISQHNQRFRWPLRYCRYVQNGTTEV